MKPITITAGHGGSDPGAIHSGAVERDLMTQLRDITINKLHAMGLPVRGDGARGINEPLANALHLIAGSSVAIELHTNASTNRAARGVEVVALPAHRQLAQRLARAIADVLQEPVRGDGGWVDQSVSPRGRLGFVVRGGLVVETFFLSNPESLAKYQARHWMVATALADELARAARAA